MSGDVFKAGWSTGEFDPMPHVIDLNASNPNANKKRLYLEAKYRILWASVELKNRISYVSEVLTAQPDFVLVKVSIIIDDVVRAVEHGSVRIEANSRAVYKGREIEKAITSATGRGLALLGFGTQFALEAADDDTDFLSDAPVDKLKQAAKPTQAKQADEEEPTLVQGAMGLSELAKNKELQNLWAFRLTTLGLSYEEMLRHLEIPQDKGFSSWKKKGAATTTFRMLWDEAGNYASSKSDK